MKRHQSRRHTASISTTPECRYRAMHESDLPQVLRIETRAHPLPWTEDYFNHCLRTGVCCRVAERHGVIEAYGIMSVKAGEAVILNLCVRPASQRRGLGRRMLTHLLELARQCAAETVCLEVRFSNLPARNLYQSTGFNAIGVEKDYYHLAQGHEDALIMARPL